MKRFSLLLIFSFSFFFFSCEEEEVVEGCTDQAACNYNPEATETLPGACNYPLESILEITYSEDYVTGLVGEEVIAHVYIRNSSCESVSIKARKMFSVSEESSAYFCFAGKCFGPSEVTSPTTLFLDSYEEDDYFKSYFNSSEEGLFELKYRFYLENDLSTYIEKTITYEITSP